MELTRRPPVPRCANEGWNGRRRAPEVVVQSLAEFNGEAVASSASLLQGGLEHHPDLEIGRLENGLRYVILPNKSPPMRFEAHLEVHAGSVDEREDEQGIAHLVEHVTFLGSKKREGLLGTGARSNAYTDFHHTVFHVHAPHANANNGKAMLPAVLDALTEIAFEPEFLPTRIEKERKAVTAEAQMMNTIEYRVDCQLLQYLHWENALGCRFPIGKMDQVQKWEREEIKSFWERHYFPGNATLYVVGDVDINETKQLIESTFGRANASDFTAPPTSENLDAEIVGDVAESRKDIKGLLLQNAHLSPCGMIRPPVEHQWGCDALVRSKFRAPISVFRHRLLQLFQLSIFCKLPVVPMKTMDDLR